MYHSVYIIFIKDASMDACFLVTLNIPKITVFYGFRIDMILDHDKFLSAACDFFIDGLSCRLP